MGISTLRRVGLVVGLLLTPSLAIAGRLDVFACEPEWAALTKEVGGDLVDVYQASTGLQDPHRIEARPSLIARMRGADLVVCTGAELEIGWLPVLLQTAGNRRVLPGTPGYLAAADHVSRLEIPNEIDRAAGDVHPSGNPHVHLDARNILRVASVLSERLAALDPSNAETFVLRGQAFAERWQAAIERWQALAAPLRGMRLVAYHKDLVYLSAWLGLVEAAYIEPKPGLPPTTAHLADLVARIAADPVAVITRLGYQDPKPAEWLASRTGVPLLTLPYTVGGTRTATDLFTLFDETITSLLGARR